MAAKLVPTVLDGDGWTYLRLAGVIDEDNELSELIDKIPSGTAVIDLGEIERILHAKDSHEGSANPSLNGHRSLTPATTT